MEPVFHPDWSKSRFITARQATHPGALALLAVLLHFALNYQHGKVMSNPLHTTPNIERIDS